MIDARGSGGGSGDDRLSKLDANDAGRRAGRAADALSGPKTAIDYDAFDVVSLDARPSSSDGNDTPRVIFVLLMPKGARDERYDELVVEPSRVISGEQGWAAMTSANLPAGLRFSAVRDEILAGLARGSRDLVATSRQSLQPAEPTARLPNLTRREREVLQLILQGQPNKNIAADLRISMRTVENHRAKVMKKTGSKSLPALVRLAIAAGAMPEYSPVATR